MERNEIRANYGVNEQVANHLYFRPVVGGEVDLNNQKHILTLMFPRQNLDGAFRYLEERVKK